MPDKSSGYTARLKGIRGERERTAGIVSSSRETLITLTPVVNCEITVAEANLEIAATTAMRETCYDLSRSA